MKFNSIVTKIWIIITLLTLLVIGISSSIQTNFMENIYYQQQARQLSSLGEKILELIYTEKDRAVMEMKVDILSKIMDVNVMIIDKNNIIQLSHGLGQNIRNLLLDTDDSMHSPLTKSDIEKILN